MLVNKRYDKDTIVSFKLVNGDEIVAKIVEDTDSRFVISKPTTVLPSSQGMALMQSLYTGDTSTIQNLEKQHVMLHAPSVEEIKNYYIQTTTGIQPVSQGAIIT
jgi:hypothetical protein